MSAQGFRDSQPAWSPASEAAPVDLDDVNSARSLAVLSVPPHSRVFDVGSGPGTVARALAARGCQVWAIDIDSAAIRLADPWCERTLHGDVETADLDDFLGPHRADAILLLDVLDHVRDPAVAIRRLVPFLAPGGRIILSVGRLFDRAALIELLGRAGVGVIDLARVVHRPEEAETDTCELVVMAVPGSTAGELPPALLGTLTEHVRRVDGERRRLQERARDLDRLLERSQGERHRLSEALEEAREWHRRSAEAVTVVNEALRQSELERHRVEEQLAVTSNELARCQLERRFFRDDVLVKDAYLATLREEAALHQQQLQQHLATQHQDAARRQQAEEALRVLTDRLENLTAEHAADVKLAGDLASANDTFRQQLEDTRRELHRVHTVVADTLAQPRYVVADRLNGWLKRLKFVHAALKRAWSPRHRR